MQRVELLQTDYLGVHFGLLQGGDAANPGRDRVDGRDSYQGGKVNGLP